MKTLKDFESELNKCSKCGLCESVCPLYKISPNDCVASKGKFIMLHGVTKGDLELSKNINNYLDMCLKCGKCNAFCPSGIDVCQIVNVAKYEYMKSTFVSKIINFLEGRLIFSNIIKLGAIISKPFRPKKRIIDNPTMKVVYFKGCINQVCPRNDIYLNKIFKDLPIQVLEPDFECCGLPFLSEGNLERFLEVAKSNIAKLDVDYDYIVTDCASCESTLLDYKNYVESPIKTEKSVNWGDLIALKGLKFKFKKPVKVTFHKPCHLKNDAFLERIMANCENVEYVKMDGYDDCCGFAGSFGIKNHKFTSKLAKLKGENIKSTKADYVITTCPVCLLGLNEAVMLSGSKTKVVSLLEFLAKADEISM